MQKKKKKRLYPLADWLNYEERKRFGLTATSPIMEIRKTVQAVYTGVRRAPKKGEWYLSGATVEAYRATNDFSPGMIYHIAQLVRVREVTYIEIVPDTHKEGEEGAESGGGEDKRYSQPVV